MKQLRQNGEKSVETVSVLMPVLNEAQTIGRALDSILAQRGVQVEVLVADGGSVDETTAIVARRSADDPRVQLLHNPRTSIPSGLNRALAQSSARFIARVDGHSEVTPDYLSRGVEWLRRDPSLAGVGGHRIGVGTTAVGRAVALVQSSRFGIGNSIYHYADRAQLTDHATFGVYRADAVRQVGGWDEDLLVNEDVDFDHRLIQAGYSIGYDPSMEVRWRVRETIPALFRQYRRYGRGKAGMVRKNGRSAVRARHLAPPLAVLAGLGIGLMTFIEPVSLIALLPYLSLVSVASWLTWRQRPGGHPVSRLALPAGFITVHTGWGLGFLEGFLLRLRPALASGEAAVRVSDAGLLEAAPRHLPAPDVSATGHDTRGQGEVQSGLRYVPPNALNHGANHATHREEQSHQRPADGRVVAKHVVGERRAADTQHLRRRRS
jgi:glycosyltransferase involved in cell wall biosynthesis